MKCSRTIQLTYMFCNYFVLLLIFLCCTCACNIQDLLDCNTKKKKKSKSYLDSSTSSASDKKVKHKSRKCSCNCDAKSHTSDKTSTKSELSSVSHIELHNKLKNAKKKEAGDIKSSSSDSKESVAPPPSPAEKKEGHSSVHDKSSNLKQKSGDCNCIGKSADQSRNLKTMSGTNTEKHEKNAGVSSFLQKTNSNLSSSWKDCPGLCTPRMKGTSTPNDIKEMSSVGLQLKDCPSTCTIKLWFEGDIKSKEKSSSLNKIGKPLNKLKDEPASSCPAFCEISPECTDTCSPKYSHSSNISKEKSKAEAQSAPTPIQAPKHLAKSYSFQSNRNNICSPECPPSVLKYRPKKITKRPDCYDTCIPTKKSCQRLKSPKISKSSCQNKKLRKRKSVLTNKTDSSTDIASKSSKETTPKPSHETKVEGKHAPAVTHPIPPQTISDNSLKKEIKKDEKPSKVDDCWCPPDSERQKLHGKKTESLSKIDKTSLSKNAKYNGLSICKCGGAAKSTCQGDGSIKSDKDAGATIFCKCTNSNNTDSDKKRDSKVKKESKNSAKPNKGADDSKTRSKKKSEKNKKPTADDSKSNKGEIIKKIPCEAHKSVTNLPTCKCPPESKKKKGCEIMLVVVEKARRIK